MLGTTSAMNDGGSRGYVDGIVHGHGVCHVRADDLFHGQSHFRCCGHDHVRAAVDTDGDDRS